MANISNFLPNVENIVTAGAILDREKDIVVKHADLNLEKFSAQSKFSVKEETSYTM